MCAQCGIGWRICLFSSFILLCYSLQYSIPNFDFANLFENLPLPVAGIAITISPTISYSSPYVLSTLMDRLPRDWHVIFITTSDSFDAKAKVLREFGQPRDGKVFHILSTLPHNFTIFKYCCYLLSPQFYESIPAEHILFFQWDAILLRQDDFGTDRREGRYHFLRDFFDFSYVGAPWKWRKCQLFSHIDDKCRDGGNGGFSFRRRSAMINITSSSDFNTEYNPGVLSQALPLSD